MTSNLTLGMLEESLQKVRALGALPIPKIQTSVFMTEEYWTRLPKTKKKRIQKKWRARYADRYKKSRPMNKAYLANGYLIAHPAMAQRMQEALRRQEEEYFNKWK